MDALRERYETINIPQVRGQGTTGQGTKGKVMALLLTAPERKGRTRQERILAMGNEGTGKTYAWLDIARHTQSDFFVIDTDGTAEAMLFGDEFDEVEDRVHFIDCSSWPKMMEELKRANADHIQRGDWLVIDMLSQMWEMVQDYFTSEVIGEDLGNYFLQIRKEMDQDAKTLGSGFDGWKDWSVINKLYRQFTQQILRTSAHVYAAAPMDKVDEKVTQDKEVLSMYGEFGYKPRGQKHSGHIMNTVVMLHGRPETSRRMTTVKDRQREVLQGEKFKSFPRDYLMKVGGWKAKKKKEEEEEG